MSLHLMQLSLTIYVKCHPPSAEAYQVSIRVACFHRFLYEDTATDAVLVLSELLFQVQESFGELGLKGGPDHDRVHRRLKTWKTIRSSDDRGRGCANCCAQGQI